MSAPFKMKGHTLPGPNQRQPSPVKESFWSGGNKAMESDAGGGSFWSGGNTATKSGSGGGSFWSGGSGEGSFWSGGAGYDSGADDSKKGKGRVINKKKMREAGEKLA